MLLFYRFFAFYVKTVLVIIFFSFSIIKPEGFLNKIKNFVFGQDASEEVQQEKKKSYPNRYQDRGHYKDPDGKQRRNIFDDTVENPSHEKKYDQFQDTAKVEKIPQEILLLPEPYEVKDDVFQNVLKEFDGKKNQKNNSEKDQEDVFLAKKEKESNTSSSDLLFSKLIEKHKSKNPELNREDLKKLIVKEIQSVEQKGLKVPSVNLDKIVHNAIERYESSSGYDLAEFSSKNTFKTNQNTKKLEKAKYVNENNFNFKDLSGQDFITSEQYNNTNEFVKEEKNEEDKRILINWQKNTFVSRPKKDESENKILKKYSRENDVKSNADKESLVTLQNLQSHTFLSPALQKAVQTGAILEKNKPLPDEERILD